MSTLELSNVTRRFGGLVAVQNISCAVKPGEIYSVIGPNGAGKTTLFNVITGIYQPSEGQVQFSDGETHRSFSAKDAAMIFFVAIFTGILLEIVWYLQSAWEAGINSNYVYQGAFPWGKAVKDFLIFYRSTSWGPFLGGVLIGGAAALSIWFQFRRTPEFITGLGMNRTFQNIRLFKEMTVIDNVISGMKNQRNASLVSGMLNLASEKKAYLDAHKKAEEVLRFVELHDNASAAAGSLPYGHQRRLEIARALAAEPKLILLDEPAAGMNPTEASDLMDLIKKIRDTGITVILIEHHMKVVMGISDRIIVLDYGNQIAEGSPEEIRANPKVIAAYLGKDED